MTSKERHEARYQRRKDKRLSKKILRNESHKLEDVISFGNLRRAFFSARRGSNWKASVQNYGCNLLRNTYHQRQKLLQGKDITRGFVEFDITERGKTRHIMSVHISERVVQKSVCDNSLVPVMDKSLIYDNGASQKGKGTDFAANRFIEHLRKYYRCNGHSNEGYLIFGDGHDYFASQKHEVVRKNMDKALTDRRVVDLTMTFIDPVPRGLSLGSQVNQINAVAYASGIDHYIKEKLRCKFYGRYMDDWYVIVKTKEEAKHVLNVVSHMYAEIGIEMNQKKTTIIKLSRPLTWLQDRYWLTATGKVIRKPSHKNVVANRRKLKKLFKKLQKGEISYADVRTFYASWKGYIKHKNAFKIEQNMDTLYNNLFIGRFNVLTTQ